MAVEPKRGCGYRKVGGLYLVSGPGGMPCDRLPLALTVCPTCSHGFKQTRGFTWVDVNGLVGGVHRDCKDEFPCPLCMATSEMGKAGMLWIGEKFYKTPTAFNAEASALGVSRRITALPRGFKVGETWVLLAHPKTIEQLVPAEPDEQGVIDADVVNVVGMQAFTRKYLPGIFKVWRPDRIEKILPESKRGSEEHLELAERGITAVFVPDNDPDHQGTVYDKDEENGNSEEAAA